MVDIVTNMAYFHKLVICIIILYFVSKLVTPQMQKSILNKFKLLN